MNAKQRKYKSAAMVFLIIILLLYTSQAFSQEKAFLATTKITLKGKAEGGILTLVGLRNRNTRYVSISTEPGESSDSVAMRLADIIKNSNPFEWGGNYKVPIEASSFTLLGEPGTYALGGTERGLGIPEPPTSLSGMYDSNQVILHWQNPASGFDDITIVVDGFSHGYPCTICGLDGNSVENYTLKIMPSFKSIARGPQGKPADFWVVGTRDGIPSSPAAIHLSDNSQEELFGIPFTNGVAPNWQMWSYEAVSEHIIYKMNIDEQLTVAKGRRYNPIETADAKPFKQILKAPAEGGTVGIWRKFLGLRQGHTYRLSARLNTLEMDPNEQGWSYSLHAVADRPGIEKLTEKQMAGLAVLPDGTSGLAAGRIANFGPGITTKGMYVIPSADITLPQDSNSITVWLRLSGSSAISGVGFDWIKLEDISER